MGPDLQVIDFIAGFLLYFSPMFHLVHWDLQITPQSLQDKKLLDPLQSTWRDIHTVKATQRASPAYALDLFIPRASCMTFLQQLIIVA
jgi:hypothetical protein